MYPLTLNSLHFVNINMTLTIKKSSSLLNINQVVEAHFVLCKALNETLYSGIQSLYLLHDNYPPRGLALVGLSVLYVWSTTYMAVRLKSKLQHNGTRSVAAWPPRHICYRPAIFFRHRLTEFLFQQGKLRREFNNKMLSRFYFLLRKSEIA